MARDVLTMRDAAQTLEVRNAYIEYDPEWDWNAARPASEVFAKYLSNTCRKGCGNTLTIEDRYGICRECVLEGAY